MRNKTITVDLNAWSQCVLGMTTSGIHPGKSSLHMKILKNRMYGTNLCKEILFPMMLKPKYKFSRAKWYEVYLFSKSWDPVQERLDWCEKQFGPQPKNVDAWSRWYTSHTTLRFRDKEDYIMFKLRWGG